MARTQQITLRLDAETVQLLESWASENGMTRAEAARFAILALTEPNQGDTDVTEDNERAETQADDLRGVCEVLRASNTDLRAEVSRLWAQLATKDEQIQSLTGLANHAQQLHAAEVTRALPPEGRTWRQRLASIFGRGE